MTVFPTTIANAKKMLESKEISALELVNLFISRIEKFDKHLGTYTQTCFDSARKQAIQQDESGDFSAPLAGIPYSLKDVVSKKGLKNTAGSKILENYESPYNATVADLLEKSGAILLGKVNTDEFTQGSSCENSALQLTRNPWNDAKVPGGSSGGSAASIAKYLGLFSIGTDTGGSIRQPANFCGVTGLKVSYGRVSRSGVISYASSFDSIGPIAPTVECTARVLEVIAGHDEKDATTPNIAVEKYSDSLSGKTDLSGKKIGVIKEFIEADGFDADLKKSFENTVEKIKQLGGEVVEISLPLTKYAIPTYYLLVKAEASTNLARYDGIRFGETADVATLSEQYTKTRSAFLGPEVKRAIMMGTYTLSAGYFDAYYVKAAKVRTLIKEEYEKAFTQVDAIVAPVTPFPAFNIGEKTSDPLAMYLADIFTVTANLAGICGLSIPTEKVHDLPAGIQILGKAFNEKEILEIGAVLEKEYKFTEIREKELV